MKNPFKKKSVKREYRYTAPDGRQYMYSPEEAGEQERFLEMKFYWATNKKV